MIEVREGGLDDPQVRALLHHHVAQSQRQVPAEFAHALSLDQLRDPAIAFFTAWDGDALLGTAALKRLSGDHGEVKTMRTHPDQLGRGVGRVLLDHLLAKARAEGYRRLSLETGSTADYAAANRLYERAGFVDGPVFGGYPPSPYNRFMTLEL